MTEKQRGLIAISRRWASEFAVIVVGILAALAVDDVREERRERAEERYWLATMSEDLGADVVELDGIIRLAEAKQLAALAIESFVNIASPAGSLGLTTEASQLDMSPDSALRVLGRPLDFDITTVAYDGLLSTGSLKLIENGTLRKAIATHYHYVAAQNLSAANENHDRLQLHDILAESGFTVEQTWNDGRLAAVLRGDPEIVARVRLVANNARRLLGHFKEFEVSTLELRRGIQAELDR